MDMEDDNILIEKFHLENCVQFIVDNNIRKLVIQFKRDCLKYAVPIKKFLEQKVITSRESEQTIDIYITQSKTCCLDLMVTQHVSNIDGIIHYGNLCLSQPNVNISQLEIPVLCIFENQSLDSKFTHIYDRITNYLNKLLEDESISNICILYDANCIDYCLKLLDQYHTESRIDIAKVTCKNKFWKFCDCHSQLLTYNLEEPRHGNFSLKNDISNYNCTLYLGSCPQIELILNGSERFIRFNCQTDMDFDPQETRRSKLLGKRIALIERIKDYDELKIGIIITNPLPNLNKFITSLEKAAKHRKHVLYFISMIQTIDDCMIGNFDLCDAFVVINSCYCSSILESLHFNRPLLTATEFKLACGIETNYGGALWPGSQPDKIDSHDQEDLLNRRRVSSVSLALVHTRNELLERCNQAKVNRWSGLEYESANNHDSLEIEEGLKGIASTYSSEPLKPKLNKLE